MGYIYIIENRINHFKYIGQTRNSITHRVSRSLYSHTRDNSKLHLDVQRYGIDNFIVYQLLQCENYKLDYYEKWFILLYNTIEFGYNSDLGGYRGKHTTGKKCPTCGKLFRGKNKYCSVNCSKPKKVIKTCIYCGKTYETQPSKNSKYCSVNCKNNHQKITMMGNTRSTGKVNGSKNGRAKPCKCIETNVIYDCARTASNELGCKSNDVAQVCNGRQKTVRGLHFEWCQPERK